MNPVTIMWMLGFNWRETIITTGDSEASLGLNAAAGKILKIDWGNGDAETVAMTGSVITKSKDYGSTATRNITLSGEGNSALTYIDCGMDIISLQIKNNAQLYNLYLNTTGLASLDISFNRSLGRLECFNNSLSSANINAILAALVAAGITNGVLLCNDQTPAAPPTGQGITDAATLESRGWTVTTD